LSRRFDRSSIDALFAPVRRSVTMPTRHPLRCAFVALAAALALAPGVAAADNDFAQKPETYICPNSTGKAIDCFLEAVSHLYTMCRQVKSIEILEFGYELAEQGVNGAKSEYCIDKHKASIKRHYTAALNAATKSKPAIETLRALHDFWEKSLVELRWHPGETDAEYKARVARPYDEFEHDAQVVRTALEKPQPAAQPAKKHPQPKTAAASTKRAN
jgi:hypothetical protein